MTASTVDVPTAYERIRVHVRTTPTVDVQIPSATQPITLKLECLQYTGSFKVRGVFNKLIAADLANSAVTAASGGNHGAALAFAARKLHVPCHVFVPELAPQAKVDQIESYGAQVQRVGKVYAESVEAASDFAQRTGALNVHAYEDPAVISGQGTVGLELQRQMDPVDTVIAAVGGGGFIAGIASSYRDDTRIVGVEPTGSPTLLTALDRGGPVDIVPGGLAADSLGCTRAGADAYRIIVDRVDRVVLVTDEQTVHAQRWLWENCRVIAEPGGATALAAVLSGVYEVIPGERLAVIVCGGNTNPASVTAAP